MLVPAASLLEAADACVASLLDRRIESELQVQTLATLRDNLLPRLISGQLRLPEAEAEVEAQVR
jgi:type I restriction enzyme S subunit